MTGEPALLLDTCALIFVAQDEDMRPEAVQAISQAATEGRLHISPMSAWEIGMLMAKGRLKSPLTALQFLQRFLSIFKASYTDLSPEILVTSSYLPGSPNNDPTDRILIATARALDLILVTSDRPILKYGADGNLRTLAC